LHITDLLTTGYIWKTSQFETKTENTPLLVVFPLEINDLSVTYKDMSFFVPFSGTIRLAKDLTAELYIHMGLQKELSFNTVLDVTLKNGEVVKILDQSEEARQRRGESKRKHETGNNLTEEKIRAFSDDLDVM